MLTKKVDSNLQSKLRILFESIDSLNDHEVIKKLTKLPGIGNWSAKMFLIFVLNRMDVLPLKMVRFFNLISAFIRFKKLLPQKLQLIVKSGHLIQH